MIALLASGCSADPTDSSHFTNVDVRNDTEQPIVLVQCDTSCKTLHDRQALNAGGTTNINVSNEGARVGYEVQQPSGRILGCLYMRFNGIRRTPRIPVSAMRPCN